MLHTKLLSLLEDDDIHNYRQGFQFFLCVFFASQVQADGFFLRRMCWCFWQKSKLCLCLKNELIFEIDVGNMKHVQIKGVFLCVFFKFSDMFGCEKKMMRSFLSSEQ